MGKILRLFTFILTLLSSALFGLISITTTGDSFLHTLDQYGHNGTVIYLHQVPEDKAQSAISTILQEVDAHNGFIIRGDMLLTNDGDSAGYRFGFYGDIHTNAQTLELEYLGTRIFHKENIGLLLKADKGATLGLDQSQADQISPLPSIFAGPKVIGIKLTDLLDSSGTVNGTYRIIGITPQDFRSLTTDLAALLDTDTHAITTPLSGKYVYDSLLTSIALGAVVVTWFTLVFVCILVTYQNISLLGVHVLLGWSRTRYVLKVFFPLLTVSLCGIFLSCGIHLYGLEGFTYTTALITEALLSGTPAVGLTITAVALASLVIFQVSPVGAIRNRVSSKIMATCLLIFYVLSSGTVVYAMFYLDGPLYEVTHIREVQQRWAEHSDLAILYKEQIGNNTASFTGQEAEHSVEYYNWYRSFEGEKGAYIVHTNYYSDDLLERWREDQIYPHVPNSSFWELVASPNYLTDHGITVDPQLVQQAMQGKRLYLLPDTLSPADSSAVEGYLTDFSLQKRESPIRNDFTKNQQLVFQRYHVSDEIFIWNTDTSLPNTVKNPVILVATTDNMTPFESESLWAEGLDNSYIKLDSTATQKYLDPRYLAKYGLDDNHPQFLLVSDFIAGLQKTLTETIRLFGIVIALVALLELVIISSLVKIFAFSKREHIAVKRLMGYPLTHIFLPPILLVISTSILCTLTAFILRSTSGVTTVLIFGALQMLLLFYQAKKASLEGIVSLIKSA
ncbi:hypothetical protein [Schaalia sp. lx-100]|uniref:hypothetical protein n=1 Tax=Schaalia sp. lx-100 TaxID=2899081 RepID=UPI001E40F839|nr:hypothetical protein [Schaalia sp. lx-100]MCD4556656.1 hypothetical protein [Schaalia sp. lx-100]